MKRKRLALLLAIAMTVTSLDSTALVASGADFSSEPTVSEEISEENAESVQAEAEDEENVEISDGDSTDTAFSVQEDETQGTSDELEVTDEEDTSGDTVFGDGSETDSAESETTNESIVPSEELIEELSVDGSYGKTFDEENSEFWFKFTSEESGTYIISSVSSGIDPKVYLFDNREITSKNDYIAENDDGHVNPDNESDFCLSYNLTAGHTYYFCVEELNNNSGDIQIDFKKQPSIALFL